MRAALIAFSFLLAGPTAASDATSCLSPDTEVAALEGEVLLRDEYGPPNFGETPAVDEKRRIRVLRADHAFLVCESEFGASAWVLDVQLVGGEALPLGEKVRVTGALFSSDNAFHYTDVLMRVVGFEPIQ